MRPSSRNENGHENEHENNPLRQSTERRRIPDELIGQASHVGRRFLHVCGGNRFSPSGWGGGARWVDLNGSGDSTVEILRAGPIDREPRQVDMVVGD